MGGRDGKTQSGFIVAKFRVPRVMIGFDSVTDPPGVRIIAIATLEIERTIPRPVPVGGVPFHVGHPDESLPGREDLKLVC